MLMISIHVLRYLYIYIIDYIAIVIAIFKDIKI